MKVEGCLMIYLRFAEIKNLILFCQVLNAVSNGNLKQTFSNNRYYVPYYKKLT